MSESKRILAVIDPTSEAQPALARSVWLAERFGGAVELFVCDYDQHLAGQRFYDAPSLEAARRAVLDAHRRRLRELAESMESGSVKLSVDARWDHPLDEGIVHKVRELEPDLVVKDTHYHSAIKRSVFTNTDWNLIRSCPAPLLLVKPRAIADTPRVMAAVDPVHEHDKPAKLDRRILLQADELCRAVEGELHVFHAFDPAPVIAASTSSLVAPAVAPVDQLTEDLAAQHRRAFDDLLSESAIGDFEPHVHQGSPRQLLVAVAGQLPADFVVMGAVSRRGLGRVFLGSTAEQVLDHVPCDLLIVKADG